MIQGYLSDIYFVTKYNLWPFPEVKRKAVQSVIWTGEFTGLPFYLTMFLGSFGSSFNFQSHDKNKLVFAL